VLDQNLIESVKLQPGDSIPSSRDLALTLGVNRNTTWAAYRELKNEGWLSASVGSGTFVKTMKICAAIVAFALTAAFLGRGFLKRLYYSIILTNATVVVYV
jgi:DNA-binding transcriptional regulator YhcF (GntR family)